MALTITGNTTLTVVSDLNSASPGVAPLLLTASVTDASGVAVTIKQPSRIIDAARASLGAALDRGFAALGPAGTASATITAVVTGDSSGNYISATLAWVAYPLALQQDNRFFPGATTFSPITGRPAGMTSVQMSADYGGTDAGNSTRAPNQASVPGPSYGGPVAWTPSGADQSALAGGLKGAILQYLGGG